MGALNQFERAPKPWGFSDSKGVLRGKPAPAMGPKLPRTGKKPGKPDDTGGVLVGEDRGYRRFSQPHTSTAIAVRMG